jgi:hypothetical protein
MDAKNSIQPDAQAQVSGLRAELKGLLRANGEFGPSQREAFALKLFRFQAAYNDVYRRYVRLRGIDPKEVKTVKAIPFLPVETFQSHAVHVFPSDWESKIQFKSSGTTGSLPSIHQVDEVNWYNEMALKGFESMYENAGECQFLGLLPGYLERNDSSLVHMVRSFMFASGEADPESSFFMHNWPALEARLNQWAADGFKGSIYLIGVTHALLRWVGSLSAATIEQWSGLNLHVVETGGMKGNGPELVRSEVHRLLGRLTSKDTVCSEYGMTELLSQAWSKGRGIFTSPAWMQVLVGSMDDPGEWKEEGQQGRLHVIDLANIASCAFLATGDVGRSHLDGTFEVLGRYDHAEVRGCNLMAFDL